jgi:hypothetical protein
MNKKMFLIAATFVAAAALSQSNVWGTQRRPREWGPKYSEKMYFRIKRESNTPRKISLIKALITQGNIDFLNQMKHVFFKEIVSVCKNVSSPPNRPLSYIEKLTELKTRAIERLSRKKRLLEDDYRRAIKEKKFWRSKDPIERKLKHDKQRLLSDTFSWYKQQIDYQKTTAILAATIDMLLEGADSRVRMIRKTCKELLRKENQNYYRSAYAKRFNFLMELEERKAKLSPEEKLEIEIGADFHKFRTETRGEVKPTLIP